MRYAKPVIKDKFWIVKDDNVNIATIEKRKEEYVVIENNVKVVYNTEAELLDILAMYQFDVKIMGEEYRNKDFTGRELCQERNIEFYFNQRDHRFSTSDLRKRVYKAEDL